MDDLTKYHLDSPVIDPRGLECENNLTGNSKETIFSHGQVCRMVLVSRLNRVDLP